MRGQLIRAVRLYRFLCLPLILEGRRLWRFIDGHTTHKAKLGANGQVIGPDILQNLKRADAEFWRDEQMVKRPAEKRCSRRERREGAATDARIKIAADPLEQLRCARPRNVVEVSNGKHGELCLRRPLGCNRDLCVARICVLTGHGRARVKSDDAERIPRGELCAYGGRVFAQDRFDFGRRAWLDA